MILLICGFPITRRPLRVLASVKDVQIICVPKLFLRCSLVKNQLYKSSGFVLGQLKSFEFTSSVFFNFMLQENYRLT